MASPVNVSEQLALVTCSYKPDLERCGRLCASLDKYLGSEISMCIIVPDRDKYIFAPLGSTNRTIISTEDVLPDRFIHLPLFKKWWLDNAGWPIRGWMMQQLTKLCADVITDCENIVFVDSDIEFISPLQHDRYLSEGALRLHRKPMHRNEGIHLKWHHAAAKLLNLQPTYFGSDYIGPLATWRRSNLIQLKNHIEACVERPWYEAVGRRLTVSEYTLYGVFVEHVLGIENAGHFASAEDLCHCLWSGAETEKFLTQCNYSNSPQAVLLQSNIGLDQNAVNNLMGQARHSLAASQ